ncbi:MAG TPA: DUF2167 domain-containing protein [Aquabacterium sp.]|nr:DUF2167 domain-containing protein [Aquabacterium sp.]HEX5312960.1 DUF2167 domain-containing protein [Aquabacterium sp.]
MLSLCAVLLTFAPASHASPESEMEAAVQAMKSSQVSGPAEIVLRDQAKLKLPAGYIWVPEPAAGQMMRAMGNHSDERELGLIFPQSEEARWMAVAKYEAAGYIKDDDAKDWNVDDLFQSLKEGTAEANKDRVARGFNELEIVGWVEKPSYDAALHRLVWSMSARDKGAPADAPVGINYNTYALGREGYISLNLLTNLSDVEQNKPHAQTLLAALTFQEGKRYSDFNASTDKVAEYGLAALVGGLAAKKLGFFALAAGLLAKFSKVILLGGAAFAGVFAKVFKRKKDQA